MFLVKRCRPDVQFYTRCTPATDETRPANAHVDRLTQRCRALMESANPMEASTLPVFPCQIRFGPPTPRHCGTGAGGPSALAMPSSNLHVCRAVASAWGGGSFGGYGARISGWFDCGELGAVTGFGCDCSWRGERGGLIWRRRGRASSARSECGIAGFATGAASACFFARTVGARRSSSSFLTGGRTVGIVSCGAGFSFGLHRDAG